jgi:hypothetical protein
MCKLSNHIFGSYNVTVHIEGVGDSNESLLTFIHDIFIDNLSDYEGIF